MKLYSKTAKKELEVETMEKEQNGQVLTVLKHASLMDIIYNQLEICKDPDCIKIEDARVNSPYPVYRCTIWSKDLNRCAVGIGSGKPETLPIGIPSDYADESASNRAFDRAAITFLQFPSRQLSEEEVGIFLPIDLEPSLEIESTIGTLNEEPIPEIKDAPIKTQTNVSNKPSATTVEEVPDPIIQEVIEEPAPSVSNSTSPDMEAAGNMIIKFGKYKNDGKTVKEIINEDCVWVERCLSVETPSPTIKDEIEAMRAYYNYIKN